jgi:general nucleoside transport system ATP-binding protein
MAAGRTEGRALELRGIIKRFGSVVALDAVGLDVERGTVHALLGENGAGKSTLMRIAFGLIRPDSGSVRLSGREIPAHSASAAAAAGVGMVHQHLSLVPSLSVFENLALGGRGLFDARRTRARLNDVMEASGLRVPTHALVRDLSIVEQQRLEILKALARGATLLILDEPTAVLAPSEVGELLRWLRAFADRGGSVVLVTHKLREALAVADHVTVLRGGRVAHSGVATATNEHELARAMFHDDVATSTLSAAASVGEPVVRASAIRIDGSRGLRRIASASFEVRRREILGIAAVEGSGHRELLSALAGRMPVAAGRLDLPPRVGYIPADRHRQAMVAEFTLAENVALRGLATRRGRMPWRALHATTRDLMARFGIVAPSERVPARTLSGGNQQRLVVAREIDADTDLLVADNPTRGLDLRATAFVHDALRSAAGRGAAVVFHSSDLDEVLGLATRMLVVFHGEIRDVGTDRDAIGRAMIGTDDR